MIRAKERATTSPPGAAITFLTTALSIRVALQFSSSGLLGRLDLPEQRRDYGPRSSVLAVDLHDNPLEGGGFPCDAQLLHAVGERTQADGSGTWPFRP